MKKLLCLVFGISIGGVTAAQAMPFHPVAHAGVAIPIASGCGIGVHRGPYSGCNAVYTGYYSDHYRGYSRGYRHGYRDGYYDGYHDSSGGSLLVDQGSCSGRGIYRICNVHGVCWAECN